MAAVNKIDSNVTGLRIAEEASLGVLPGTPIWTPFEPNSYNDFGGDVTSQARNPISNERQRKKGVITDLEAAGGFTSDITQTNLQSILQGFFFADLRLKGEQEVTLVDVDAGNPDEYEVADTTGFIVGSLIKGDGFTNASNNALNVVTAVVSNTSVEVATGQLVGETPPTGAKIVNVGIQFTSGEVDINVSSQDLPRLVRASGAKDFTTFGLNVGEWIFVGGDGANEDFVTAANNGFKRIRAIAATYIEFDKSGSDMSDETGTGLTIRLFWGRVLKNETGTSIKRRSYQLERTLGAPDDSQPTQVQSEYLIKAVPNEAVFNFQTADKATVDLSFIAGEHETRTGVQGVKSGTRPSLVESDAFNTSSDVSRIKLHSVSSTDESVSPLFAYVTDMKMTINNNLSANKAIGVLGAFDITAGTFAVNVEMEAYFADVAAIATVKSNADITMDVILVKANAGIAIDFPLMSIGGARADIQQDQPIKLPINGDVASGSKVVTTMNHTILMSFFDYLPNAADV